MALPISIEAILDSGIVENNRIEYKSSWNPEAILHTICAFANDIDNSGGGYVFVGVEEGNGRPVRPAKGIDPSSIDTICKDLLEKCNLIEPKYIPIAEEAVIDGESILVIWVPGGYDRPYKCPVSLYGKKSEKAYYIRKLSSTIRADRNDEKRLFEAADSNPFDDRVNLNADIKDLRLGLITEFLNRVGSNLYEASLSKPVEETGAAMRIIRGPSEFRKPVNVGLMFFSERPDDFFPYARIEVVDKPDPTGIGMTERIFTGPLDRQLSDALSYIRNYIIKERVTKLPDRAEAVRNFNFPYAAVEEALANAVYHKSYQIHEPITVTVTPEAMDILSIPGPDPSISDEDINSGHMISDIYRNRRIGDFLKELRLVEGRNTGIPRILRAMEGNGSPAPVFKTNSERSYFRVILPVHEAFLTEIKSVPDGSSRMTLPEMKNEILEELSSQNMSLRELAESLYVSKSSKLLAKAIRELVDEGRIDWRDKTNPHSRNQKLCIQQHAFFAEDEPEYRGE